MSYLQTETVVSFNDICHTSKPDIALKMRNEIVAFLEANPQENITLDFGGYSRLVEDFAKVLFDKEEMGKYYHRIAYRQMHIFDGEIIGAVMRK